MKQINDRQTFWFWFWVDHLIDMAVQAQTMYFSENLGMSGLQEQQDWGLINPPPLSNSGFDHDFFCGLIPSPQAQQQPPHFQHIHGNQLGISSVSPSLNFTCNSFLPTLFSDTLSAQLDSQRREIDCILQLQVTIFIPSTFFFFLGLGFHSNFFKKFKN